MDAEWERRADAEEDEALAARDALRSRRLSDVAVELLHRGDVVAVAFADERFVGTVLHAGDDLVVLRTATGDIDVCLTAPVALQVVERVRFGGLPRGGGAQTFTARLFEHEAAGATVEVGCPALGTTLRGRMAAVATDHVVLDDGVGTRWFLARTALAWVRSGAG